MPHDDDNDRRPVMILDAMGVLRGGFILLDPKPDHTGLMAVLNEAEGSIIKVHPRRVNSLVDGGSVAVASANKKVAACPVCGKIHEIDGEVGQCSCGQFKIIETIERATSKPTPAQKTAMSVDLESVASNGELWINDQVKFDDRTKVVALVLRIGDRYLSFNLYNGSYGKKGKTPPVQDLANGVGGYVVKNLMQWQQKLRTKGYKLFK